MWTWQGTHRWEQSVLQDRWVRRVPPKQDTPHLQLQGRPLCCLHTCQAATASLDPQEDGNFGAVQASIGKYADLLWEGREKRARM